MKLFTGFLSFIVFLIVASLFSKPAHAITVRGGDTVYVPKNEVVTGTLFAGGNSVTIDGILHGDLLCGAQSVVISGTVDGDVICGAQSIRIPGSVGGSVRAGAQTIEIAGVVKRNVTVAGQTVSIESTGAVQGEVMVAAQQFTVTGPITMSVAGGVERAFIDGNVGGDMNLSASNLTFGDRAKVAGSVTYESSNKAILAPAATIAGTLTQTLPKVEKQKSPGQEMKRAAIGGGPVSILWKIIMYSVVAFIIQAIAPKRTQKILDLMREKPMKTALTGLLVLIVVPVIILVLVVTLVGIPLAILLAIVYGLVIAASRIFAAMLVGEYLLAKIQTGKNNSTLLQILLGVTVTWIIFMIPVVGGIAGFLAVLCGLGALYESRKATSPAKKK